MFFSRTGGSSSSEGILQAVGARQFIQGRGHAIRPRGRHPALQNGAVLGSGQLLLLTRGRQTRHLYVVKDFHIIQPIGQLQETVAVGLQLILQFTDAAYTTANTVRNGFRGHDPLEYDPCKPDSR